MIPRLLQPRKIEPRRIVPSRIGGPVGPILWDAVAGLWQFDGDAKDSSPHGRDGTIVEATPGNVTFVDGQFDRQAIRYSADGDYVSVPHHADLNMKTAGTIFARINIPVFSGDRFYTIADKSRYSAGNNGWFLTIQDGPGGRVRALRLFRADNSGTSENLFADSAVTTDTKSVAATWDLSRSSDDVRLFVDGVRVAQMSSSLTGGDSAVDLLIGAGLTSAYTLLGDEQDVYLATDALSDADVMRLHNGEAPQDV